MPAPEAAYQLRPYRAEDEDAAIALWLETWRQAYPAIDFAARVPWWRRLFGRSGRSGRSR